GDGPAGPAAPEDGPTEADASGDAEATADGTGGDAEDGATADGAAKADGGAPALSEAAAELAAQKIERERIARRKAEREGPVEAGAKLSGRAAELLAAVRAVEGGGKPPAAYEAPVPPPASRTTVPAPAPERAPVPAPAAVAMPSSDAVQAVRAVLARGGAPESLAPQAAAALGDDAAGQLAESPWRLLAVAGVRPTQADGFARALLGA
ncbi:DNA helicase RecD, partial [Streptomyces sp. ISL-66]|nr:DNA helicase RecD [Streptomyces sp. ISL-66]